MKKVTRPLWSSYGSDTKTKAFLKTMAKAILKYDLSDPDDRLEHLRAIKATVVIKGFGR